MANYAIMYNDTLLQTACPNAQVIDVSIQPIPVETTIIPKNISNGSFLVRSRLKERNVIVTIELPFESDIGKMAGNARKVRKWAEAAKESRLILPDYSGKYLNCILTNMSTFSIAKWYEPIQLTFTAFSEPCFQSIEESEGTVGNVITIAGDENASITISHKLTQALSNPIWTLATGYNISLNGSFSSGTITIDCEKGYVSRNGQSIMKNLQPSSRFYKFPKGNYIVSGPSGGKIKWRERWHD